MNLSVREGEGTASCSMWMAWDVLDVGYSVALGMHARCDVTLEPCLGSLVLRYLSWK